MVLGNISKGALVGVMVCFLGCSASDKFESESFSNFNDAQRLIKDPTKENLKIAEILLQKVDQRSVLYKDAQGLLEKIPATLKSIESKNNDVEIQKVSKNQLAQTYGDRWLKQFKTATEIKLTGKNNNTLKVLVNFQTDQANKVIHDPTLITTAKKAGIKRIEFHDWSGLTKEYLSHDIQ